MPKRVITAAVGVAGLVVIGLGVASATVWRPDDVLVATTPASGHLVVTDPGVLELGGDPVTIRATTTGKDPVVLAIGRDNDVAGWVGADAHVQVTGLASWDELAVDDVPAGAQPSPSASPSATATPSPSATSSKKPSATSSKKPSATSSKSASKKPSASASASPTAGTTAADGDDDGSAQPDPTDSDLWVARFDAPDGVLVSSRGGLDSECPSPCGSPPNPFPNLGAFTMPVFRSLTPAGARQFHFGADLGTQASRSNVGIYNGGVAAGTATIALYRACDDALLGVRTVSVPANFALQVGMAGDDAAAGCSDQSKLNTWLRYVIVTMDQPSLTYVFNVARDLNSYPHLPFGLAGF